MNGQTGWAVSKIGPTRRNGRFPLFHRAPVLKWVWLLLNDAQAEQFQVLDEKEGFLTAGKGGDMIISLGFGFKNTIQRIGGTRPAANTVIAGLPHESPCAIRQRTILYGNVLLRKPPSAFPHLRDADLVEGRRTHAEFSRPVMARETRLELRPLARRRVSKGAITDGFQAAERRSKVATPKSVSVL